MSDEVIRIPFEPENHRSAAYDGEKQVGECLLRVNGAEWTITHTGVDPSYGGRGIAKDLVLAVVEAARAANAKLIPRCSYAAKVLSKPEYSDLVIETSEPPQCMLFPHAQ